MDEATRNALRALPSVEEVLQHPRAAELVETHGRAQVVEAVRVAVDAMRQQIMTGDAAGAGAGRRAAADDAAAAAGDPGPLLDRVLATAADTLTAWSSPGLRRVLNLTGVVVHTNLGRSRLAERAVQQVAEVARSYSNLEYDLQAGNRGRRESQVEALLKRLTGAEDAFVVNNNAGAVLLLLMGLAAGRDVLVSRGQLVEIGGSFRMPDIMRAGGVCLVEVGTTNRTRVDDYEAAITGDTAMLMRVHTSNYRIMGFTEEVQLEDLVELGRRKGVLVVDDLGSGALQDLDAFRGEPTVAASLRAGVDVVCFSGDKLLGGPQAGMILGSGAYIEAIRANPLNRALRVDKFTLAALEATLLLYRSGRAATELPVLQMILARPEQLRAKALKLTELLSGCPATVRLADGVSEVGGGSLPLVELPTTLVTVKPRQSGSAAVVERLRLGKPALLCYIREDKIILDPRTIRDEEIWLAADLIKQALNGIPA